MIGGVAAKVVLMVIDPAHMLLVDPLGYFLRYGIPMAAIAGLLFAYVLSRARCCG